MRPVSREEIWAEISFRTCSEEADEAEAPREGAAEAPREGAAEDLREGKSSWSDTCSRESRGREGGPGTPLENISGLPFPFCAFPGTSAARLTPKAPDRAPTFLPFSLPETRVLPRRGKCWSDSMLLFEGHHCWNGELLEGMWLGDTWESRSPLECPDRLGDGAELFALLTVPETLYLLLPPEEELEESPRTLF